jgi:hypothetical protein
MERVTIFALPFLGEGVRVTFEETVASGVSRRLLFFYSGLRRH